MKRNRHQYSVLDVLGGVCSWVSGTGEHYPDNDKQVDWLKWRVDEGWDERTSVSNARNAYEEAIRLACIAAIEAYEATHVRGD